MMSVRPPPVSLRGRRPAPEPDRDAPSWFIAVLVGIPSLLILVTTLGVLDFSGTDAGTIVQFPELFRANTPTGGDIGAHVLLPQILEESVLASGRLLGWSNAWFAGFPVLFFYPPLPMLSIVALDVFLPYGVAFKIAVVAGLVALPGCTYLLVRWLGFDRIVAAVASMGGGLFVFMMSYVDFGGNIKTTLIGGFAHSWSIAFAVLYIGLIGRAVRERRPFEPLPGILLALLALSHVASAVAVVCATAVFLVFRRSAVRTIVASWALGFGLAAFWALPFAWFAAQGMMPDPGWLPNGNLTGPNSPFPGEIAIVLGIAALALAWTVARRDRVGLLVSLTAIPLVAYLALPGLGISRTWAIRLLPYWFYGLFVLAGIGIGLGVARIGRQVLTQRDVTAALAAVTAALAIVVTTPQALELSRWADSSFSGYESRSGYDEYAALMMALDGLPPGRVIWEYNLDMARYGSDGALMAIPYWSPDHPSMQGLYRDSSLTAPFNFLNQSEVSAEPSLRTPGLAYHPMDFDRAKAHLDLYAVRYYVSYTDVAAAAAFEAGLIPVADAGPWEVFELPESPLIDVARLEPSVWAGTDDFAVAALDWYDDVTALDHWLAESGPDEWERVASIAERPATDARGSEVAPGAVTNVRIDDHRISFDTTAIGTPHLVKVSYFPNWTANGASGPYRAAPSLMLVVPEQESVVLTFERSGPETAGIALTVASIALVAAWWYRHRRRTRSRPT